MKQFARINLTRQFPAKASNAGGHSRRGDPVHRPLRNVARHRSAPVEPALADAVIGPHAEVIGNPHNQTLNVAVQWGAVGVIVLYAMWFVHLLLFRGDGLVAWLGPSVATFGSNSANETHRPVLIALPTRSFGGSIQMVGTLRFAQPTIHSSR
jgi:hypothetical protein